jgi:predicted AlkP superfamily phosphohydrolase/phosphomutase
VTVMTRKTLFIGLDGATFTILDSMMARGVMPGLRDLVGRGARGTLQTVVPALTPPGWTSLMTGKRPGQHGVFDFLQKEGPTSEHFRLTTSDDIRTPTFWDLASTHDLRVISLNFPVMFPAPPVNGFVVPGGWMPWRQLRLGCHPPDLFDRLRALPSFSAREMSLDMTLEEKAVEGCDESEYVDWVALHARREQRWFDVATYLIREEPSEMVGIVFDGVDKLQHLCWRFLDPSHRPAEPSERYREISDACDGYFRQLDGMIAELVELAGPGATVVLASDHGGGPTSDIFCVNAWLEQQGYLAWIAPGDAPSAAVPELGFRQLARHVFELDWDRTVAYAATPSSQGIHIVTQKPDGGVRMDGAAYLRLRVEIAEGLRGLHHPSTGAPIVEEVWTRDDVFAGPYESLAPDLSFTLTDGAVVSIARADSPVKRRPDPAGSHRFEGIFIASGPEIRAGAQLDDLSIVDVAPFLLHSLGLPIPTDMAGRVPADAFEPEALRQRPPQLVAPGSATGAPEFVATVAALSTEEEAEIFRRLRTLGYVE